MPNSTNKSSEDEEGLEEESTTNKLDEMLSVAESHMGEGNSWVCSTVGIPSNFAWCAAFVCACAKTVGGILGVVIYESWSCGEVAEQGVKNNYGTWLEGPWQGKSATPQTGDLVLFRWQSSSAGYNDWYCDHIGIVEECTDGTVTTIEGNKSSKVDHRTFSTSSTDVYGYFRPNWASIGVTNVGSTVYGSASTSGGSLYTVENTSEDATMREVCYWNNKESELTLDETKLRCSVVNYTSALGSFLEGAMGGSVISTTGSTTDVSNVTDEIAQTIIDYIMSNFNLNTAAACGVCGNIYRESQYNPAAVGDNGTSFGLCQWHYDRGDNMKSYVGSNWSNNVSGQLDFLKSELLSSYSSVYSSLKSTINNESGAKSAANIFCRQFEEPNDIDNESSMRQDYASQLWNMCVVQA